MNIYRILITSLFVLFLNLSFVYAKDCNEFDKLSKEYAKCKSELLKEKTTKKANELKEVAGEKIKESKKKFNKSKLKEKLIKFKNSKSHKEFTEN